MTVTEMREIEILFRQGYINELDVNFARFIIGLAGDDSAFKQELSLAAALVSCALNGEQSELPRQTFLDIDYMAGRELFPGGVRCPEAAAWLRALGQAGSVIGRPDDITPRPMVLDGENRLYFHRYWEYEKELADRITAIAKPVAGGIDAAALRADLERLFPDEKDFGQILAAYSAVASGLCVITGGPGTGKTTTVVKILKILSGQTKEKGLIIALAAPTGKAAARLQESVGGKLQPGELAAGDGGLPGITLEKASTIHTLLGSRYGSPYFHFNADRPLPHDVVIVDEASMINVALMSKLAQAMRPDARLILLGDKDQLGPVEAGPVLGDLCATNAMKYFSKEFADGFNAVSSRKPDAEFISEAASALGDCIVELTVTHRFDEDIRKIAEAINAGNGGAALELLNAGGRDKSIWEDLPATQSEFEKKLISAAVEGYGEYLRCREPEAALDAFDRFRILCATRLGPYGVENINKLVERALREQGLIKSRELFYPGRPVMVARNDYTLKLFNGDTGLILETDGAGGIEKRAFFRGENRSVRSVLPERLPRHETAFAITVHKSQGSEFDSVLMILPDRPVPVLTKNLIYTGITRTKQRIAIWGNREVFLDAALPAGEAGHRTPKPSGLRDRLWGE